VKIVNLVIYVTAQIASFVTGVKYRNNDYVLSDILFDSDAKFQAAEQLRWFQPA
jgi:hypothetical protein